MIIFIEINICSLRYSITLNISIKQKNGSVIIKILICVSEYPPKASGIGNVVKFVCQEFVKMGNECTICSPSGPDIILGNQSFIDKFGGLGIVYFWYKVCVYFKKESSQFDAIWLHQPLFLLKKSPFKTAIITVHTTYIGKNYNNLRYSMFKRIYYSTMKKIEKKSFLKLPYSFTFIDVNVLNELLTIGVSNRCTYISNGVDTRKFIVFSNKENLKENLGIDSNHIVFLFVGRLIRIKQPFLMLDTFKLINEKCKQTTLLIVGTGNLLNDMKKYVLDKNIKNVRFLGFVSHNNLSSFYSCADYYIITSEYEGQPLTLLEAMSSGLPCIVSDIPSLRIVKDANCGIVVNFSENIQAAHNILDYIKKDNSMHAKNARKYAEERFDWGIIAENYLREFKNQ